jgi:ABC-type nitrate/sulfonate/bicarbonate transport system permease component
MKIRLLTFVALVGLWWVASRFASEIVLPSPDRVLADFAQLAVSGRLISALALTLTSLLIGAGLAAIIGIALGLLMGARRSLGRALDPVLSALYITPFAAVAPLFVLWFGIDATARTIFIFVFTLPQIAIVCYQGARSTPERLLEVGRVYGASDWDLFRKAIVPHQIPFIFTALRLGVGRAVQGMVVAELVITAIGGVGYLIKTNSAALDLSVVLALILFLMLLGVTLTLIVQRIEDSVAPWRRATSLEVGANV